MISSFHKAFTMGGLAAALIVLSPSIQAQGLGCATSSDFQSCINPVPMTNVNGTWVKGTDNWIISMPTVNSVSGSVRIKPPSASCPDVSYEVSGTISFPIFLNDYQQASTTFSWTAQNPNPSTPCNGTSPASSATYTGTLRNNSNDLSEGTIVWSYIGGGSSSSSYLLYRTPNENPVSENSNGVGFGTGQLATVAQFRVELVSANQYATPDIFRGRQVREYTSLASPRYDTCYFDGSTVPKFDSVQGSTWNIGYFGGSLGNFLVDDYIGWNTSQVDYYRQFWPSQNLPCSSRIQQQMSISVPGFLFYTTNDLWTRIYPTYVTVQRGSVTQTVNR